eukprot:scaffold4686_cov140-Amphora_coffeaeformis.AAC.1
MFMLVVDPSWFNVAKENVGESSNGGFSVKDSDSDNDSDNDETAVGRPITNNDSNEREESCSHKPPDATSIGRFAMVCLSIVDDAKRYEGVVDVDG